MEHRQFGRSGLRVTALSLGGSRELTDDGAALPVTDGAALLFLRLVPLAGG